jgi:hypothetical protein
MENTRRGGRPPLPTGERVADLPKLTLPMRPEVRQLLAALSRILNRTVWKLIEDSILRFYAGQAIHIRAQVESDMRGAQVPPGDSSLVEIPTPYVDAVKEFVRLLANPKSEMETYTRDYITKFLNVSIETARKETVIHEKAG